MYKIKTRLNEFEFDERKKMSEDLINQADAESDISEKQKVFYFGHTEDAAKYFDLISKDILSIENCAIFFIDIDDINDPEYYAVCETMNLFVAAVTGNFVYTENETDRSRLGSILQFAKEHNKPVLPIMVEPQLENKFNEVYEDLQLLDRTSNDSTQISYKDKLTDYLRSVLIDDDLANKIKSEFDSYIFLSYRKKDREHAQRLMRLIHSNKKYRDIAIWYDEFLIPGENFRTSIDAALKKSDVFALAVTPNILEVYKEGTDETPNFVMGVEYPEAVKRNKKIFPAELVSTDREELKSKFNGIADCLEADDTEAFSAGLAAVLDSVSSMENNTPEHDYLIGLAYLNGIDVERDSKCAIGLISSSADRGYAPAMKRLADMYKTGVGTDIDKERSLHWQQLYAESLKTEYENSGSEEDGCVYVSYLLEICGYCDENYINNAVEKYEEMLKVCEELNGRFGSLKTRKLLAKCHERLALVYNSLGINYDQACEYIARALNDYRNIMLEAYRLGLGYDDTDGTLRSAVTTADFFDKLLSDEPDDIKYHIEFDRVKEELKDYLRVRTIFLDMYCRTDADKEQIKNIAYDTLNIALAVFYKCGKKFEDRLTVAECNISLGDALFYRLNNFTEAAGHYLASLEIFSDNIAEDRSINARMSLIDAAFKVANSYNNMAYFEAKGSGCYDVAEEYYIMAIEQAEAIVQATAIAPKLYFTLAQCYSGLVDLYTSKIYEIIKETRDPNLDKEAKAERLQSFDRFLTIAYECHEKCEENCGKVTKLEPKIQNTSDFREIRLQKGYLFKCAAEYFYTRFELKLYNDETERDKLLSLSLQNYRTSLSVFSKARENMPNNRKLIDTMCDCCRHIYRIYNKLGDVKGEEVYMKLALDFAFISEDGKNILQESYASGCFYFEAKKYDRAAENYQKALEYVDLALDPKFMRAFLEKRIRTASIKSWLERFC